LLISKKKKEQLLDKTICDRFFSDRIGRRAPLAVLILISGLSSVSLAITYLGTGFCFVFVSQYFK